MIMIVKLFCCVALLCFCGLVSGYQCPPPGHYVMGNNYMFDALLNISYGHIDDIVIKSAELVEGDEAKPVSKLMLYNGRVTGGWGVTRYHKTAWWCGGDGTLFMGTYIGIPGPGVEFDFKLARYHANMQESSCSVNDGTSCGGVGVHGGNAWLVSYFVDGTVIIAMKRDSNPFVYEIELTNFPIDNVLADFVSLNDDGKNHLLSGRFRAFIQQKMNDNFLPSLQRTLWLGFEKSMLMFKPIMNEFNKNKLQSEVDDRVTEEAEVISKRSMGDEMDPREVEALKGRREAHAEQQRRLQMMGKRADEKMQKLPIKTMAHQVQEFDRRRSSKKHHHHRHHHHSKRQLFLG